MTGVPDRVTDLYSPSPEELEAEKQELEGFLDDEPQSLDRGLVELRQKFLEEEERRRDIESKAAGILAVSGIMLALVRFIYEEFVGDGVTVLLAFLLFLSILLSLANLVPVGYKSPRLNAILRYTYESDDTFTRRMYVKYHTAISNNQQVNRERLRVLRWSYVPLVLAVLLLTVILMGVPATESVGSVASLL